MSLQAFLASSKEALVAALNATDDSTNDQLSAQFYDTLHDAGEIVRTDEADEKKNVLEKRQPHT